MSSTPAVLNMKQALALLGVSRSAAYKEIKNHGTLAGLPVIRVGVDNKKRRIIIPTMPLLKLLGLDHLPEHLMAVIEHYESPDQ